ncbi:S-4TM family putative pore-forming effector, partial [Kocuria marina]|uniref:S-4TM family putative pore-forming effector n=2 Tax=Kocuria marina TaxID=223184 RepID=UPI00345F4D93
RSSSKTPTIVTTPPRRPPERHYQASTEPVTGQETLDHYLFDMPETITRSEAPSPEDIAIVAGDQDTFTRVAQKEKLLDWYTVHTSSPGIVNIAIAQRSNAAYTDRLIRTMVTVWAIASALWLITLVTWASLTDVTLATFLLGALLPVLPVFLDVTEYVLNTWQAAHDRADLAATIARRLTTARESIQPQDLLVWQERLFELRRTTPQVPNWLYKLNRPKNENAMNQAAQQLGQNGAT